MILDRKWFPKSTANDPERKIGRAWTQVSGSLCKFYYYYKKSDYKLNFTSQINTRIKTKWKKSFKCKNEVGRQHTPFTSCQNAASCNEFFFWRVDYTSEENVLTEQMWFLPLISYWEVMTRIFCGYCCFWSAWFALWCKSISFDLFWIAMLFIAAK